MDNLSKIGSSLIFYFVAVEEKCNLVPRLFLRGRKDPGRSWSRGSQILGAKLKLYLGRGGRGVRLLRLENYNFCVIVSGDKI